MNKLMLVFLGFCVIFGSTGFYLYRSYKNYQNYVSEKQSYRTPLIVDDVFELNQNKQIVNFSAAEESVLSTQDETTTIASPTLDTTETESLPQADSQNLSAEQYKALVESLYRNYSEPNISIEPLAVDAGYTPSPLPEIVSNTTSDPSQEYCNSQKSYLDSHNQYLISSENSRYQSELEQLQGTLANNGTYGGGSSSRAIAQIGISHQNALDSINAGFDSQLADLKNQGCNF